LGHRQNGAASNSGPGFSLSLVVSPGEQGLDKGDLGNLPQGTAAPRVLASTFPSVGLAALFVLIASTAHFLDGRMDLAFSIQGFGMCLLNWSILPGIALLLGASPFLKDGQRQPSRNV
jgi:hypothetical protein